MLRTTRAARVLGLTASLLVCAPAYAAGGATAATPKTTPAERPAEKPATKPETKPAKKPTAKPTAKPTTRRAGPALGLQTMLAAAVRAHPKLGAAQAKRREVRGKRRKALGAFDPKLQGVAKGGTTDGKRWGEAEVFVAKPTQISGLELVVGWRLDVGKMPEYKRRFSTDTSGDLFAGATLPLLQNRQIDARRRDLRQLTLDERIAAEKLRAERLQLRRDATVAYWKWVAAGQTVSLDRALVALAKDRQKGIERSVREGALAKIDAIENRRAILKRQGKLIKSEQKLAAAALKLSLYWRDAEGNPIVPAPGQLPGDLPAPPATEPTSEAQDIERALKQHPKLAINALERRRASLQERWAADQRAPALDLNVGVASATSPVAWGDKNTEAVASLKFKWAWDQNKARGAQEAASAAMMRLDAYRRFTTDKLRAELRATHLNLRATRQQLTVAIAERDIARRSRDAERVRVQLGARDVLYLNIREQYAADAQRRVIQVTLDYHTARALIDALTARE